MTRNFFEISPDLYWRYPLSVLPDDGALSMWAMCGSWCAGQPGQTGIVPSDQLSTIWPPAGPTWVERAELLVSVGLWREIPEGWQFVLDGAHPMCRFSTTSDKD